MWCSFCFNSGKLRGVIKELVDRRVKLKVAERLATGLAEHVQSRISDRERRMREEYETKLQRQATVMIVDALIVRACMHDT